MRCQGSWPLERRWLLHALVIAVVSTASIGHADPAARPVAGLADLDTAFATAAGLLAKTAENGGHAELAKTITEWDLPAAGERQIVVSIPARLEKPSSIDTPDEMTIWNDFCAARRTRASGFFEHAVAASRSHDHVPTRDELARPVDPDAPPLPQRSCEAIRLLFLCLRDDPDHERARTAGGWVKRGDDWLWPEAARRLDKGEVHDPAFGWMPKAKLERHRAGERLDRGRWITAAEDAKTPRDVKHGREFFSDHWEIVSAASLDDAAALALRLEETADVWRQVFGAFAFEPKDLEKRLTGRGRTAPHTPHSAILCADRGHYLQELEPLEPLIGRTNGIYWTPTKTIWFFIDQAGGKGDRAGDAAEPDPITIHHEATHQLFAESRHVITKARQLAGERCGFWVIEAAGCYLETIRPTPYGWTVGGRDAGRVPAAKERLDEGFFVPLADLCGLGRKALQADERLSQLYSQFAGLADFFMNGSGGRYRESFVEYLVRVYSGTADPDTLSRLCKRSYADLDAEYRRHLSR
ncbi:MAG: hypothetical protein K8S94_12050 [Planctomycetia bacterium]|nr:hypothetical protein [Planctomycetia bacterium]